MVLRRRATNAAASFGGLQYGYRIVDAERRLMRSVFCFPMKFNLRRVSEVDCAIIQAQPIQRGQMPRSGIAVLHCSSTIAMLRSLLCIASLAGYATALSLDQGLVSRRSLFQTAAAVPFVTAAASPAFAATVTGANDGNLPDLPPDAVRSYLQYRIPLQTSADFYVFDLQDLLDDTSNWGEVGQLFAVANNRGQGNPSRIEREFTNVMRILSLSMPPDTADGLRDAQFKFERAMAVLSKTTSGIRRDLPVEIDPSVVPAAKAAWNDGRVALNEFFAVVNESTGLNEMKPIPAPGPSQFKEYGRSLRRYVELKKKIKLCQNRGGPTLSAAWGQLMVTGYLQDSCGVPDLEDYFFQ